MSKSTATNGPLKQPGGGNMVHSCAAAGGSGKEPPEIKWKENIHVIYSKCL